MIQIITQLSPEDLLRWRSACVHKDMVDGNANGVSPREAEAWLTDYYRMLGDIFTQYGLQPELSEGYFVSPMTGHVILTEP